mmetsp:Transcript_52507/g.132072  ORF Transcript_52507/g.132072 Transcript_52507/m.132072 type:complete len:359 (-) Transcript_52507:1739-2815(-)
MLVSIFACAMLLVVISVFGATALLNRHAFSFMVARRAPRVLEGDPEGSWHQLERSLDNRSTVLLNTIDREACKRAIRRILLDDEEILWIEKVSMRAFLRHNHDFIIMVLFCVYLLGIWVVEIVLFVAYDDVRFYWNGWVIGFGVATTVVITLALLSTLLKCRVVYALTDRRAIRVSPGAPGFADRVYSFPFRRMEMLHMVGFDSPPATPPGSESGSPVVGMMKQGRICWKFIKEGDETFSGFEFVDNISEVEQIILEFKTPIPPGSNADLVERITKRENEQYTQWTRRDQVGLVLRFGLVFLVIVVIAVCMFLYALWVGLLLIIVTWHLLVIFLLYRKQLFLLRCAKKTLIFQPDTEA